MTLVLPRPPEEYNPRDQGRVRLALEQEDNQNLKRSDVAERTSRTVESVDATTTVGQGQDVVVIDSTGGNITITLPPAADRFKEYTFKRGDSSANTITIDGDGAETIDGASDYSLVSQYDAVTLVSDGTQWLIIAEYP